MRKETYNWGNGPMLTAMGLSQTRDGLNVKEKKYDMKERIKYEREKYKIKKGQRKFSKGLPVLVLLNGKFEKGQIVDVLNYEDCIRYEVFIEKNLSRHYQEVKENQIKPLRKRG